MKELYNELKERLTQLEENYCNIDDKTTITDGRIAELQLVILRVQQILLNNPN